jgi:uncharacterized protein (DUF885 family)
MNARCAAIAIALLGAGCPKEEPPPKPPPVQREAPPPTLAQVTEQVFTDYFTSRPVTATALGEHSGDARWPDVSATGIEADRTRIDTALASLDAIDASALSPDEAVDLRVLRNGLELQKFEHEVERPWARDPYWYTGIIGTGLDDLVSRDFAPLEQRGASLASRMEALPVFIEQAKAAFDPPNAMRPQTEVAMEQIDGIIELIRKVIPVRTRGASDGVRGRIGAATGPAVSALRDLQADLRERIRPNAEGSWRLGPENFERKLALTLQDDLSASELRRLAVVEHGRVRKHMAQLAYKLGNVLFSKSQLRRIQRGAANSDVDSAVVSAVLAELGAYHVQPPKLRDAIELNLQRLAAFVRRKGIVPMDDSARLEVIWTPPHQRGVFIAGLAAPGPLEPTNQALPSFYLVQPIPESWDAEVTESYLREYNNFMLEVLSIHEAIPGHFVQANYAKKDDSKVRRVFQSNPFVEGWAVYAEKVMVDEGYAGIGPSPDAAKPKWIASGLWRVITDDSLRADAIALHRLKFYLRTVTNAILDHAVHTTNMSREEALELLITLSFQQEGEAIQKWIRAQVTSTQLSTYFVGAQAWFRLRKKAEVRARDAGQEFQLGAFHAEALSHGAPPVHLLPELMGWTAPPQAAAPSEPPADPAAAPAPPDLGADDANASDVAENEE